MSTLVHLSIYWQMFGMIGSTGVFPATETMADKRVKGFGLNFPSLQFQESLSGNSQLYFGMTHQIGSCP